MPKHYIVPENVINEFVSKVTKHGDKVTAILRSEKESKIKRLARNPHLDMIVQFTNFLSL